MYRHTNHYLILFRSRTTIIVLILLVFLGLFVVSCDEVGRHNILTFFFEGVPPLRQDRLTEEFVDTNSPRLLQTRLKQIWYIHQPRRDCTFCHDKSRQRVFSSQTYLIKPVPELCYECHADYTTSTSYVHGPVAVGQCLLCHNPHRSRIEHLLKEPTPQLCYVCHNIDTVKLIPAHLIKEQFACTDCHNAHTSSIKYLLKEASLLTDNGVEGIESSGKAVQKQILAGPEKQEGRLYDLKEMTDTTTSENNSLFQVFWTVGKLIEKGQIKEARAYLEIFKESNSFTNEQWRKVIEVLNLMDINAAATEEYSEKLKQQSVVTGLYYLSLSYYYAGQLEKAKEGLIEVLKSDLITPAIAKTIKDDLIGIDNRLVVSDRKREIAELYYRSMSLYHAGQFEKARGGLVKVLESNLVPEPMIITIKESLTNIDNILSRSARPQAPEQ